MRTEAHIAALRAAAQVAFSVALLNGCAAGKTEAPVSSDDALTSANAENDKTPPPSTTATAASTNGDSKNDAIPATCAATLASELPAAKSETTGTILSPEATSCCRKVTASYWGAFGHETDADAGAAADPHQFFYQCCDALDWPSGACTPWGPPVPPAMKRAQRRPTREVAAFIAQAVA